MDENDEKQGNQENEVKVKSKKKIIIISTIIAVIIIVGVITGILIFNNFNKDSSSKYYSSSKDSEGKAKGVDSLTDVQKQILGVEDGKTYTNNVQLDYSDNSGINYVIIKRKNISSESYDNNIDIYNLTQNGEYIIKVSDFSGNICQKNIKIEQ